MKKVFLYVFIGLLLLAIPATIFFLGQQRDIRTRAAPATTLTLTPDTQSVSVGGSNFKLSIDIDPGANQVISANIYLTYDPTKLEAITITNGASAPKILNSGKIESGTASIQVGAASNSQPITSRGSIAVITFKPIGETGALTPTQVQFASNTFVGGLNEPTANVLAHTAPAKITVTGTGGNSAGQNFSSESITGTPSATPRHTPTLTPTLALTGSPSVTPVATSTPTPASPSGGLSLTPTLSATGSAESSASATALQILTPEGNSEVSLSQPVIRGTAPPGSIVTIVIHSDSPQTATVIADANGNWVYTPATALDPGVHSIVASSQTDTGATQTATTSFIVASGAGTDATDTSVTAVPISGSIENTLILIGVSIILIAAGILIPVCF